VSGLPWQFGVPAVGALVPCGEETHRVRWRRGKLLLDDHDLGAERALVGLGADRCACLELLGTWQESFGGDRRLVLSGGVPKRRATRLPRELDHVAGIARLVQQTRRWSRLAEEPGGAREALFRRLLTEFRDAVAASLLPSRQRREVQRIDVKVRPLPPGDDPTLEIEAARGQVRIVAELSVSWLVQVWAWGLATVEGALALEVLDVAEDGRRLAATLLRWEADGSGGSGPGGRPGSAGGRPGRLAPTVATAWVERDEDDADDVHDVHDVDEETGRAPGGSSDGATAEADASESVAGWRIVDGPPIRPRLWWDIDVRR